MSEFVQRCFEEGNIAALREEEEYLNRILLNTHEKLRLNS